MSFHYVPYIWLLVASACVTAALGVIAWRRRTVPGAKPFLATAVLLTAWCIFNALEAAGADLNTKLFWANMQYMSYTAVPVCWFAMALDLTSRGHWLNSRRLSLFFIVPAITVALIWTNDFHSLMRSNVYLDVSGNFPVVGKDIGPAFWAHAIYSYTMILGALALLVNGMSNAPNAYRSQFLTLQLGTALPLVWNITYIIGLRPPTGMDSTPVVLGLSGLVIAWGLFHLRIFSLIPIAHRQIISSMEDGILVLDTECRLFHMNPSAERILRRTLSGCVGIEVGELLGQRAGVKELCHGQDSGPIEIDLDSASSPRCYEVTISPLMDGTKDLLGRLVTLHDITNRKDTEEALKDSERRYRELADMLPQPVFETNEKMQITFGNRAAYESFGYSDDDLERGLYPTEMVAPEDRPRAAENLRRIANGETIGGQEYTFLRRDGTTFPVIIFSTRIVRDEKFVGLRGIIVDITERKAREDKLVYARFHDPLTDLHNRAYFDQELHRLSTIDCLPATIVVTDIDCLKEINDSQGHLAGDEVLRRYATVLKQTFRKTDVVARVGGDEFAFILPWTDAETTEMIHQRLQEQINIHNLTHSDVFLSISWGAETIEIGEMTLADAFRSADLKMYADKLHRKTEGAH